MHFKQKKIFIVTLVTLAIVFCSPFFCFAEQQTFKINTSYHNSIKALFLQINMAIEGEPVIEPVIQTNEFDFTFEVNQYSGDKSIVDLYKDNNFPFIFQRINNNEWKKIKVQFYLKSDGSLLFRDVYEIFTIDLTSMTIKGNIDDITKMFPSDLIIH
jgi:hypothetical protein